MGRADVDETGPYDAEGRRTGVWIEHYADGTKSAEVTYLAGLKHGRCTHWFSDGSLWSDGEFANDVFTGDWFWNRSGGGLLQRGAFERGAQHGHWQRWYANGQLMDEGDWNHGKRIGPWTYFNADGSVKRAVTHRG